MGRKRKDILISFRSSSALAPASDEVMANAVQMDGSTLPEVQVATGRSFIPEEERPAVGSAAIQQT